MKIPPQQEFFPSLMFPKERQVLRPHEVAAVLRVDVRHVYDLVEEGKLRAINIAGAKQADGGANKTDRRFLRIPVESWQKYLAENTV